MTGLTLTYSYFQIPLMVIIITPAILALRPSWREAAENLGASTGQYWRMVGLPVLAPSLLSAWILLFGSAFSAYATAYALTSGNIGLVTTEISNVLSGNVMASPQTGAALSLGMIVVMVAVLALQRRARAPGRALDAAAMRPPGRGRLDRALPRRHLFPRAAGDDGRLQPVGRRTAITGSRRIAVLLARPRTARQPAAVR